nr:hypothetical protein [Mycobacterium sp. DL99]
MGQFVGQQSVIGFIGITSQPDIAAAGERTGSECSGVGAILGCVVDSHLREVHAECGFHPAA